MTNADSSVSHARLRGILVEAGAKLLAEDALQRSEPCTLETWVLPGKASRLMLIRHWCRTERWEHFMRGSEPGTGAAIWEILAAIGQVPPAPSGDPEASSESGWHGLPF